ncbi:hypothetical protein [Streptomyces sp. NPDC001380]|uniref:hypothetical protein n=1 Tax=Streptomyces sp. NPDC001380 TaxID=3364566 RepID=UPI0036BCC580
MRFVHDAAGRETERAFGSAVLRRAWDGRHRQLGLSVAVDGRDVLGRRFTHRADGVLVGAEDALSGLRSYELDLRGRVTAVTAEGWTERYAYDPAGNVTRASSGTGETDGDRVVERGRLRRAGRASYEYDGQGRVVRQTRRTLSGSVLAWEYTWDSHDQLTSVQAEQWARRLGERRGEEPAVLHYRVPRDELDALHGRRFGANEDAALGDFIRNHRADTDGSAMHDYDMVEGKMLLNMNSLRDPNVPMRLGGRQIAFSRQGRADLVNRSFHAVHEVG